jgi:hypothetical protein
MHAGCMQCIDYTCTVQQSIIADMTRTLSYAAHFTTALRNTERVKSALQACVAAAVLASATQGHDTLAFAGTGAVCYAASVVADKLIELFHRYEFNHQDNE